MNPRLSVIIPVFNATRYLPAALESVMAQGFGDFECICVDDGSTDGSDAIVADMVARDPRFVLLRQPHGNAGRARNAGLDRACGEFVTFLDADDIFESGSALSQAVARMIRERLDLLVCRGALTDDQNRNRGEAEGCFRRELIPRATVFTPADAGEGLFMMAGGMVWAKLFRREFIVKNRLRFADLSRSEDFIFAQLALMQATRIGTLDRRLVRHRIGLPMSLEATKDIEPTQFWTADRMFLAEMEKRVPSESVRTAAAFATLARWSYNLDAVSDSAAYEQVFALAPEIRAKTFRIAKRAVNARFRWAAKRIAKAAKAASSADFFNRERKVFRSLPKSPSRTPTFSIVLPTFNRAFCICTAIDSVLRQTFAAWTLLIVDDGSTDGTEKLLRRRYSEYFGTGRFVYLQQKNAGVCAARNKALVTAQGDWIAYLDSDNTMRPEFLQTFVEAIYANPDVKTFYGKFANMRGGAVRGEAFDWDRLLVRNFIDLGVFVHHRCLVAERGGFDLSFRRLVDWELVLRYTRFAPPVFIDRVLMDYNNSTDFDRITGSWLGNQDWKSAVMARHGGHLPLVTTLITTYGHAAYIAKAIESAMRQDGPFRREIIVSDDGSKDGTASLVAAYAEKYPHLVRNISPRHNLGIAANLRRGLAMAGGDYVAILEGDDFWTASDKLARQVAFLQEHDDCPMVFSRLNVLDEEKGCDRRLPIQDRLSPLLSGRDFFAAGSSSVIVNFSCCLFRCAELLNLPDCIWYPRPSEIAFAFWLERRGPIGFISTPLSVYRVHAGSTWSGAKALDRRRQEIACRETALKVCDACYADDFRREIERIEETVSLLEDAPADSRFGAFSMKVLRLFRGARQCLRDNGWKYTLRHVFDRIFGG